MTAAIYFHRAAYTTSDLKWRGLLVDVGLVLQI